MAESLRSHITDVLEQLDDESYISISTVGEEWASCDIAVLVDALLADPTLAAIYDLAAWAVKPDDPLPLWSTEVHGLLANWRSHR